MSGTNAAPADALGDDVVQGLVKDLVEDVTMFLEIHDDDEPEPKRQKADNGEKQQQCCSHGMSKGASPKRKNPVAENRNHAMEALFNPPPAEELRREVIDHSIPAGVFFALDCIQYVEAAPIVLRDQEPIPVEILDGESPAAVMLKEQLTQHFEKAKARFQEYELRSEEECDTEAGPSRR